MRQNVSYEKVGTTAIGYFVALNGAGARVSGLGLGDFTFELYDPADSDIAGATVFTLGELGATGLYAVKFTIPSTQGSYSLLAFNPTYFVQGKTAVFMAYVTLIGDTGDSSAQLDFWVFDNAPVPAPVTGLVSANFTWHVWTPGEIDVGAGIADPITELGSGKYRFNFDSSAEEGRWLVDLTHATYFTAGKIGVWRYNLQSAEVAGAPDITNAVNDNTGTSATLSLITQNVNDEVFVYYRTYPSGSWTLFGSTRIGDGDLQVTGLTNNQKYEFIAFASRSGSPVIDQSPPSNTRQVYVTDGDTTFTAQRQALYGWASSEIPITWIWIPSNGPQPATPFGTIQMKPMSEVGNAHHSPPDDNGVETITSDEEYMFEAQVYGTKSPTGEDPAYSWILALKASLKKQTVLEEFATVGLAFVEVEAVTDLGAKGRTNYEARAMIEVRFRIGYQETDTVGYIQESDAPTGTVD